MFRVSKRSLKLIALSAIVAAFSVTAVSSAAAAPAAFNIPAGTGIGTSVSGTLAVTDGVESTNCTFFNQVVYASNSASNQGSLNAGSVTTVANCTSGKQLSLAFVAPATNEGGSFKVTNAVSGQTGKNPLATGGASYVSGLYSVPFVNGSGATPSKLTFSSTLLGSKIGGGTLSATGSLTIRKGDGSLLLLS